MSDSPETPTSQEWDEVRTAFASSIMVDTSLSSLAQNLEGPDWPIKGSEENASAYIDLTFDEARELLALKGYPEHLGPLISILKDTLAFDDPFGDMLEQTEEGEEKDNQLIKNMGKLGVADDFPILLTTFDEDTREFCRLENLTTVGGFARFAQGMSQNVIVGGDFRKLLNALSHVDEKALAEVLPFRVGATGLHLFECLAQSADNAAREQAAFGYFSNEWEDVQKRLSEGASLSRMLVVLNDEAAETRVAEIIRAHAKVDEVEDSLPKKRGIFGSISRLFGK